MEPNFQFHSFCIQTWFQIPSCLLISAIKPLHILVLRKSTCTSKQQFYYVHSLIRHCFDFLILFQFSTTWYLNRNQVKVYLNFFIVTSMSGDTTMPKRTCFVHFYDDFFSRCNARASLLVITIFIFISLLYNMSRGGDGLVRRGVFAL